VPGEQVFLVVPPLPAPAPADGDGGGDQPQKPVAAAVEDSGTAAEQTTAGETATTESSTDSVKIT
jgi:hypothetical protein